MRTMAKQSDPEPQPVEPQPQPVQPQPQPDASKGEDMNDAARQTLAEQDDQRRSWTGKLADGSDVRIGKPKP